MKSSSFVCRMALALVLCLALASPALAASAKKSSGKKAPESIEVVQKKLDEFALKNAKSINACILPSENKKEFTRNKDGSWTARYISVDVSSMTTSVKKTDNPNSIMPYSGSIRYKEIEYICTAPTKDAAGKGPFKAARTEMVTEPVIKYINGRWTN